MGNLLRVLSAHSDSPSRNCDIFVNFESAQPTESEYEVWTKVEAVFRSAESIILELSQYRGATDAIRNAISNPRSTECQDQAWKSVTPLVLRLKRYYEFSLEMGVVLPDLLRELCSSDMTPRSHFETQQALFKQFAEILDFVLKFDDLKMTNPSIQNDFSYYRRTLSKTRVANSDIVVEQVNVSNEMANRMSLFYADATPMLKSLGGITTRFVSQHRDIPIENTTDCLSTMASICRVMIENPSYIVRFQNEETKLFCLRVMVGAIILYDHVHPVGAFAKASGIETKSSIKLLKDQQQDSVEGLLNALRYSTKHLNDESTPKATKLLLA